MVRAVRIGDSVAAPDLTLAVEPNDFGKVVKAGAQSKWMEERGSKYQEFWAQLMGRLGEEHPEFKSRKAPTRQYIGLPTGYTACHRGIAFGRSNLKVELYLGASDAETNAARLEALYERKEEIESIFGEPMSWEELEGRKAARVAFYRDASILNSSDWGDYFTWIEKYFAKLTAVTQSDAFESAMVEAN